MANGTRNPQQEYAQHPGGRFFLGSFGEGFGTGFDLYGPTGRAMGLPSTIGQYSDQQLQHIIDSVLAQDPLTANADINVGVNNAVVTLTGTVRHRTTKLQAGSDAWSVPTVHDVHNNIEVKPRKAQASGSTEGLQQAVSPGAVNDQQLTHMVYDAIDADPNVPSQAEIQVHVNDRRVTLTGTVPSRSAKRSAGNDTWNIPAVADVHNQLQIKGRAQQAQGGVRLEVERRPAQEAGS